ncbi:MAG TPA: DUF4340 domain-containing protein [Terriglobia bacterium]|nr:DUF4340 domain-containing protein [Terriglobia bacterium]
MKGLWKTLIALVVLAALWAGFNYYNKRKSKQAEAEASKPKQLILPVKAAQVQKFTIAPRGGEAFTVVRTGSNWDITQPRALPADQKEVSSYVDSLVGTSTKSVIDQHPRSLKDYGLDPPDTTLDVTTTGKPASFTLRIGDSVPTGDAVYAQVGGESQVITLEGYGKSPLEKGLFDLRDRRAMTLDQDQIQRLEVTSSKGSFTLTKNPEGYWDLVLPPAVRADNFAVDNLMSGFQGLPMVSILKEQKTDLASYGFNNPTVTVKVTSPAGTQTVTVGRKDGNQYDAVNSTLGPVFTISSDFVTKFQVDPASLRDKNYFSFSNFDAKTVDITTPKDHRIFAQTNFKWRQTTPSARDETTDKMEDLLNALTSIRATTFPKATAGNLAAFGLTKPACSFKVVFGDKNTTETVNVGVVNGHYYAARSTDALPGEVSKSTIDSIEKALGAL